MTISPPGYVPSTPGDVASSGTTLYPMSGGGPITLQTVEGVIGDGFRGIFLDHRDNWTVPASGLAINGMLPFLIESRMQGGIGWNGVPFWTTGSISTTPASGDGIQIYASSPTGNPTNSVIFKNCCIIGSNPGASVIHFGGGQRECGLVDSFVYNQSNVAGSYAVTNDTAISNNNGENMVFTFAGGGGLAGNYAALGLGIADQGQHSNDCWFYELRTSGGTYSIVKNNGGGDSFSNWYDRSNPVTATVWNHGGNRMCFYSGECQNTVGLSHLIDASSAQTVMVNRALTQSGTPTTTAQVSAGQLLFEGCSLFNNAQTIALSGSGKLSVADPHVNASNLSVSGSAGTVYYLLAAHYVSGTGPTLTGFTGTETQLY